MRSIYSLENPSKQNLTYLKTIKIKPIQHTSNKFLHMKQLIFLFIFLLALNTINATTYYVATNGNDNTGNGSINQPFASLTRAIEAANPGDVIELRNGTYTSNEIRVNKSNLTIRSYPGEYASLVAVTALPVVFWFNVGMRAAGIVPVLILEPSIAVVAIAMSDVPSNEVAVPVTAPEIAIVLAV